MALWGWQVVRMKHNGLLDSTPNFAALGGSPYGRTLAMVMQGPVGAYWHGGAESGHVHGPECNHGHEELADEQLDGVGAGGLVDQAKEMVGHLNLAVREPNTPRGQSQAHIRYLRRQIERKLETAYWLDPGNYANFNALMLFLTEDAIATQAVSPQRVLALANHTIAHVEQNEKVNPEPWLTAASAVHTKMEILGRKEGSQSELQELLGQFEHCLARFAFLRDIQIAAKRWSAISSARRSSMDERARSLHKLLEAQAVILKNKTQAPKTH